MICISTRKRAARKGINPMTGAEITIYESTTPVIYLVIKLKIDLIKPVPYAYPYFLIHIILQLFS